MSSGNEELAKDLNSDEKQAQKKKKMAPSYSAGDLVWAKVSGFKFWAGKVHTYHSYEAFAVIANLCTYQVVDATKEQFLPEQLKEPPKKNCTLVRFFGTYD